MTLCPIALAVGCKRCVAFPVCPLKTVIGDYKEASKVVPKAPPAKTRAKTTTGNQRKRRN